MTPELIVAVFSGLGTLVGALSGIIVSSKLTSFRLERLEKKVDEHNHFGERIPALATKIENLDTEFKTLHNEFERFREKAL